MCIQVYLVVDNTYLTSYLQRPLELGADLVMYSLSKYMNGHSDVIMGALVTSDDALHQRLRHLQECESPVLYGLIVDKYQIMRTIHPTPSDRYRTIAVRLSPSESQPKDAGAAHGTALELRSAHRSVSAAA